MKNILITILSFFALCLVLSVFIVRNNTVVKGQHYIAHAGGAIDGLSYTNCMEAVNNAISKGIVYIELDLCITSDSVLVAAHDWAHFNKITGYEGVDSAPRFEDFKTRKIHGKYTPISYIDIVQILRAHPNIFLVTDKISDPDIIDKYFKEFKPRLCVECFSIEDYLELSGKGYYLPMLSFVPSKQLVKDYVKDIMFSSSFPNFFCCHNISFEQMYNSKNKYYYLSKIIQAQYSIYNSFFSGRLYADSIFQNYPDVKFIYVDDIE